MNESVVLIPLSRLVLAFGPAAIALAILFRWTQEGQTAAYALGRMVGQLLVVGYVLAFIFGSNRPGTVLLTLAFMLALASRIALRPLRGPWTRLYPRALLSIAVGSISTLVLVTQAVLDVAPWHDGRTVIPLAGMIFAMSMNTVSLAAERYHAETDRGTDCLEARRIALRSALIPQINSLFAVGLVSLPGMMTGQILSGVPPLIAVRYQIMVMSMIFGAAGISSACYLALETRDVQPGSSVPAPGRQPR